MGNGNVTYRGIQVGSKNDYLTLEQSAQVLGKPTSWLKGRLSRGELGAKLSGGQWLIAARDLDKVRADMPPEPEKVVHDFLTDIPPKRTPHVQSSESKGKAKGRSDPKRGTSKPSLGEPDLRKHVKDLNKQIRQIKKEITKTASEKRSRPSAKAEVRNLVLRQRQLEKERDKAQSALSKSAQARKKVKAKKARSTNVVRFGEVAKGQALYRQIKAVNRKIRVESTNYERAKQENRFYDEAVLKRLILVLATL